MNKQKQQAEIAQKALTQLVKGLGIVNELMKQIERDGPDGGRYCAYCGVEYLGHTTVPHFIHMPDCPVGDAGEWILETVDILPPPEPVPPPHNPGHVTILK